jgi:hypothetical protein
VILIVTGLNKACIAMQLHTDKLKDMMELYQFEQLIKKPTRVTENTSTLIDLAFTNKAEIIVRSEVHHI